MNSILHHGIEFHAVQESSVFLGTRKGGWIYSGQRPHHEVKCPDFYIMKKVFSQADLSSYFPDEEEKIYLDGGRLNELILRFSKTIDVSQMGLDPDREWEVRSPSEGEWRLAHEQIQLDLLPKKVEVLADGVSDNYRGAMMDGRPRPFEGLGPMAMHRAAIETHPTREGVTALSSAPMDRQLSEVVTRFVITPVRSSPPVKVPKTADLFANIRGELFWTAVLGVTPSFVIPIARGMGDYAVTGWANLLFGGLCAGFVTGAFWRPKRPTIFFEDGEEISL
jgi:hypothetical protein